MRVGVLGANGQVGAELCLILARQPGVDVVPICRSRFGSAYLRYNGIACRHGDASEPACVEALIGDCDMVVDLALASLAPDVRAAKSTHDRLIDNQLRFAPTYAKHIYFSTMSVYGDPIHGRGCSFRNLYAQEKMRCESTIRSQAQLLGKSCWVFRLGHVCGELQNITSEIRKIIKTGTVAIPDPERLSNTVYVQTIADAVLKVAGDNIPCGTYDLMNVPQWSWRSVFDFEGAKVGVSPRYVSVEGGAPVGVKTVFNRVLSHVVSSIRRAPGIKRVSERLGALLPIKINRRVRAIYAEKSASGDIAKLTKTETIFDAALRSPVGSKFAESLTDTRSLLADARFALCLAKQQNAWPLDLSPAERINST